MSEQIEKIGMYDMEEKLVQAGFEKNVRSIIAESNAIYGTFEENIKIINSSKGTEFSSKDIVNLIQARLNHEIIEINKLYNKYLKK